MNSIDLKEMKRLVIEHLATITDEQFDEELRLAGIENQPLDSYALNSLYLVSNIQSSYSFLTAMSTWNILDSTISIPNNMAEVSYNVYLDTKEFYKEIVASAISVPIDIKEAA
jgi:hypothetical protein